VDGVSIENPWIVLLIIPCIVVLVIVKTIGLNKVYPRIYMFKHPLLSILYKKLARIGVKKKTYYVSLAIHSILIGLIVLALSNPYITVKEPAMGTEKLKSNIEIKIKPPVILIIDVSGSMSGAKIEAAKKALLTFIKEVGENCSIGLIAFSDRIEVAIPPTEDIDKVVKAIDELEAGGGTMYTFPLTTALNWLIPYNELKVKSLVIFASDGMPGDPQMYKRVVRKFAARKIPIYSIFITTPGEMSGLNEIKYIANTTGGEWYRVDDIDKLVDIYREISKEAKSELQEVEVEVSYTEYVERRKYFGDYIVYTVIALYIAYLSYRFRKYHLTF